MWDLKKTFSLGRYHQRHISILAASFVVAIFSVLILSSTPALAADATRNGSTLSYDGKTFTVLTTSGATPDKLPTGLPSSTSGYQFVDTAANKTHFILTSGDADAATTGQYVFYDGIPASNFSNSSPPITVSIADGAPGDLDTAANGNVTGCDGSITHGIGWILCPTVNFLASGMDNLYQILSGFLIVQPIRSDSNSSIYRMWAIVRDIANICFVIAFLYIVYSQVTGIGITNYGIKRMLPRLMIGAILVNVSFWISSSLVDVSNVVGESIHTLFMSIFDSLNTVNQYSNVTWSSLTTYILSGGTVAALAGFGAYSVFAAGLGGSLILLIPTLLGVLIAALVAILVMAARQALIICLVVVSPLAFVAYLLPNTEKYFDKWKDLFITMLVMFPAFSLVFAGAQLAGLAIVQNAGTSLNLIILGMAVMVAPVVITPLLIKFSGSLIGKIAGLVNNPKKGAIDRTRNWAQGRAQEKKAKILAGMSRDTWANRRTQGIDRKRRRREGWKKAYEGMADNHFADSQDGMDLEAQNRGNTNRKQEIDNKFARTETGRQLEYQSRMLGVDKQRVDNEFNTGRYGHAVSRAQRTTESDKKRIENEHDTSWNDAIRTSPALMEQELNLKRSTDRAQISKNKLEEMHTEITSNGLDSEHILNLRGVDAPTRTRMLNIARDIKDDNLVASVTATAKASNERQISENLTTALKDNVVTVDGKTIVQYAAGVRGEKGERAVLAKAMTEVSNAQNEDIKNIQVTMDYDLATNNSLLRQKFEQSHVFAEKIAYAKQMTKNGAPGVGEFRKLLTDIGDFSNPSGKLIGKEDMSNFKELLAAESSILAAGKDLELFLTNITKNDASGNPILGADGKPTYSQFGEVSNSVRTWSNMSAVAFASQNAATQFHALDFLFENDRDVYRQVIDSIRTSPAAIGNIKQGVYERYSIYSDGQLRSSMEPGKKPLPQPGSIAERDAAGNLVVTEPI